MKISIGALAIMVAAFFWAVDALIRTPLTKQLSPLTIVFFEHVVGLFVLSPFAVNATKRLRFLTKKHWLTFVTLALVSSIGGTILFTQALSLGFATGDFVTPLLLQKLQPVLVTVLAVFFLKERISRSFLFWATLAFLGGYLMSFGATIPQSLSGKEQVALLALGAALCWGSGTILSKKLLADFSPRDSIWYRFLFTVMILLPVVLSQSPVSFPTTDAWIRFFIIAVTTGSAALLVYYHGLAKTPAHVATFAELVFPLTSILIGITTLNPYGTPQTLTISQIIGILLLLVAVTRISLVTQKPIVVTGLVVKGKGDGKKLGFPTANITVEKTLTLPFGVYACLVTQNKILYKGVLHYGPRIVFGETHPLFEVHIFDFHKQLYGQTLTVEIRDFIRPTQNFANLQELVKQITHDCEKAKKLLV